MDINQALAILSNAGGVHSARIITQKYGTMSRFAVWRAARMLRRGVPVAKIIHEKWFYGLPFYTNMHTLDPRPETETLVESVLHDWKKSENPRILDLGTGTGCIIVSLVSQMPTASGVGVDISNRALGVAQKNVRRFGLCRKIELLQGTFSFVDVDAERFDIIVSNPPYIARGDKRVNDGAKFDPDIALYADNDGLAAYTQIAFYGRAWMRDTGRLYLEIGAGMSRAVRSLFESHGWKFVRGDKDLGGKIRTLVFSL